MKYKALYEDFINLFPNDRYIFQKLEESADAEPSDGMHIMFGMVVVPYLLELLANKDELKLKEAFAFFEKMARSENKMISEVLEFTVLEDIISHGKDILEKCKQYMGEKTLEGCSAVEKYMM